MKLNIGCGETKLEGYTNVDLEASTKPDVLCDLRQDKLPFDDDSVEEICMFHAIEHIEFKFHQQVFMELHRVLAPNGKLNLAYPEFSKCATNFIGNYKGMKDFWRMTLYGRQLYAGDYHVVPMDTMDLMSLLKIVGFKDVKFTPEPDEPYNTFLTCVKGTKAKTKEDILREDIFEA